jgi:hypothetical protein
MILHPQNRIDIFTSDEIIIDLPVREIFYHEIMKIIK